MSIRPRHPFATMSMADFLGHAKITRQENAKDLRPTAIKSLRDAPPIAFLRDEFEGRLQARFAPMGSAVWDGDRVIASYDFGDTLVVDRAYRHQGIASELIYQWRMRYPAPAKAYARTQLAQRLQERVWRRIQAERFSAAYAPVESVPLAEWNVGNRLVDGHGAPVLACHGTTGIFEDVDPTRTGDGGIHFGTPEQARMRTAGKDRTLYWAHLRMESPRRSRDAGGHWRTIISAAKSKGHDGIVYLNRYEGMTTEIIERLERAGRLATLDTLTDAQFRRVVPEAQDSYIVFSRGQIYRVQPPDQEGNQDATEPSSPTPLREQSRPKG